VMSQIINYVNYKEYGKFIVYIFSDFYLVNNLMFNQ
jgi:hypothetical protein